MRRYNKRAELNIDSMFMIAILLVFGLSVIIGTMVSSMINDMFQEADSGFSQESIDVVSDMHSKRASSGDNWFTMFFVLFAMGMIVSGFLIDSHPIFFVVTLLLFLGTMFVGVIVSNVYDEITADGDFKTFSDELPKMNFIMDNLLWELIAVFALGSLSLYAKQRRLAV